MLRAAVRSSCLHWHYRSPGSYLPWVSSPCYKLCSISQNLMASPSEVISAAQSGNVKKLSELLQNDPLLASARDENGVSALMHAYYRRQQGAAELLVSRNASLDIFEAT